MAIIKKYSPYQNLSSFQTFLMDTNPNSDYFRITEFKDTFTGGKNGFLIEGSEFLKETTEVKVEILDVEGNPVYFEPGDGNPEYYEGLSKLVSVHVYDDTPIGISKITILGELKNYINENGASVPVPDEWKGIYNVKWEKSFKINKNLNNEDVVRFYKRPIVNITEIVKPIFNKTIPTKTISGSVSGIPQQPSQGSDLSTWSAGTLYKLVKSSGSWDVDIDENPITVSVDGNTYTPTIIEVLNEREVLVDVPYTSNNIVQSFTSQSFTASFQDIENEVVGESSLTGSFAKIDMYQLKTFVGDVARVKIFRRSKNQVNDFQLVQESKLESTELLRDVYTTSSVEIPYGQFSTDVLTNYWETSSNDHTTSVNSAVLNQAVKVDYDNGIGGIQTLKTQESFTLSKDVEYTLSFRTLLSGSSDSEKYVKAYFSGSYTNSLGNPTSYTQSFMHISGSDIYKTRQSVSQNILAERDIDAKLVFEFKGDDWYVSNVSLRNAQETSFSPDEFTLIQDIPRKLETETFDFRFEFYDINNNYIPVDVTATKEFDGGNDYTIGGTSARLLIFESDRNAFRFESGSIGSPYNQTVQFQITKTNLTGSTLFESRAFDTDGNYLDPSDYSQYPGLLTNVTPSSALLTLSNFTGSYSGGGTRPYVGSIVYTASLENLQEFETVYRLEDGDNAPQLIVTSNANQFIYEPTTLSPKPSGQSITVRAQRKNLASLITPLTINKSDSNGPDLNYVSTVSGVDTYTISALQFSASFAQNNFDEITYSFTGSDVFGNEQYDEITLSKVINFDAVSFRLSNPTHTFAADSTGVVTSDFTTGDGSVTMFVAGNQIQFDDNGLPNTFEITNLQGIGCVPLGTGNGYDPTANEYGIREMSSDSASLDVTITYTAGDGSTTQTFTERVTYTKAKIAAPVLSIETTNKDQSVSAFSTGEQVDSFSNSVVTVKEQYVGSTNTLSLTSLTATRNDTSGTVNIITPNEIELSAETLADGTNTTTVSVEATVTDSEGTSRTLTDTISLSKVKNSVPNIEVTATPLAQTIEANSLGSGSAVPQSITVSALEGGTSRFTSIGTPIFTNGLSGGVATPGSPTLTFTSNASSMSADTGTVTIPVNYTDSEGTLGQKTVKATISRVRKASPTISALLNPQSQTVDATSGFASVTPPDPVTLIVNEGGDSNYTYTTGTVGTNQFKITGVTSGTNNNNGTITPTTPDSANPKISGTVTYSYGNSEGTIFTGKTIDFSVGTSVQGEDGRQGDVGNRVSSGLIYYQLDSTTAPSTPSATSYTFSTNTFTGLTANWAFGAPTFEAGNTKKYWYSTYNVTETTSGGDTGVPSFTTPTQAIGFTGLVTFTSTNKITDGNNILENVPSGSITNHIGGPNVTTIDGGKISTGMITSTGYATTNPDNGEYTLAGTIFDLDNGSLRSKNFYINSSGNAYFKGQVNASSGTFTGYVSGGSMRFGVGVTTGKNGIYIDSNDYWYDNGAFSFGNGALTYSGSGNISINGAALTFNNQSSIDLSGFNNDSGFTDDTTANQAISDAADAQSTANTASSNASTALSTANTAADNLQAVINGNTTLTGTFINDKIIYSPNIAGNDGYIQNTFRVGPSGITLDGANKKIYTGTGTWGNSNTPFYVDNSSNFSLGANLTWNGSTLAVNGDLTAGLVDITSNNITLGNDGSWGSVANINFLDGSEDIFCQFRAYSSTYGSGLRIEDVNSVNGLGNIRMDTKNIFMMPESTTFGVNEGFCTAGTYVTRWLSTSMYATDAVQVGCGGQGLSSEDYLYIQRNASIPYHSVALVSAGQMLIDAVGGINILSDTSISINPGSGNWVFISGNLSKPAGSFMIDHPLPEMKDTHYLVHSFVESPQANNIYRGRVTLENGTATINLDIESNMTEGTWVRLNRDPHVYTSNETDWDNVRGSVDGNILTIECQNPTSTSTVTWMVLGERHDDWMMETTMTDENGRVIVELEKDDVNIQESNDNVRAKYPKPTSDIEV